MLITTRVARKKFNKMGDIELHQESFEININLDGTDQTIRVSPEETTDGVEFFRCSLGEKNITQIRKEKDGSWEQMWGALDVKTIETIGQAITNRSR